MALAELVAHLSDGLARSLAHPQGIVALVSGGVAGALIIAGTMVKTILPLRWLAVASNIGFIVYGAVQPAPMVLLLHAALLPINLFRAREMMRMIRRVRGAADAGEHLALWLKPYMKLKRLRAGAVLFRQGDTADHLYFLAEGRIEFVERGRVIEPGRLFGEIAFFAPDRRRTSTARCLTPCKVLRIDESTFKQLYYQNPDFGFEVVRLIAARLGDDVRRLEGRLAEAAPSAAGPAVSP